MTREELKDYKHNQEWIKERLEYIEELKEEIGQERRAKAKTSKKGNTPKNKKNINIEYSDEDFIFDEDE